jgi:CRP-like cAMP-binding protein
MVMFLRTLMEQRHDASADTIDIPMTRSDIASYLGISLEAVVRACHKLEKAGVVDFVGRHTARILNHAQFDKIAAAL